jgi:antitoxin ParD1/3/4
VLLPNEVISVNIELPSTQQDYLKGLVADGRFPTVNDAVREGVDLLISREDLKRQVQIGIGQVDRRELSEHDSVFQRVRSIFALASARRHLGTYLIFHRETGGEVEILRIIFGTRDIHQL